VWFGWLSSFCTMYLLPFWGYVRSSGDHIGQLCLTEIFHSASERLCAPQVLPALCPHWVLSSQVWYFLERQGGHWLWGILRLHSSRTPAETFVF
jgi:hypothetical protein